MKILVRESKTGINQMRQLWAQMKQVLDAGIPLTVEVNRESRSVEQNAMFHSIIGQIAKQAQHAGSKWDAESWKRLLVDKWYRENGQNGDRIVANLDGDGIVQLGLQTRKFTKADASDFTEFCLAWAAQNGIEIDER